MKNCKVTLEALGGSSKGTMNYMVDSKSLVGIKPGDSIVFTGYQVDEFTCTWLAKHFLFNHTFTKDSWARCHNKLTSHLNQGVRITL